MADLYPPSSNFAHSQDQKSPQESSSKPQATFLTKLYSLLERPENHHMIRWDPAGEHIIVERPEQLALHVLPSIYRQSRFASFSRQLNIYGFMRKVNLRNVDPAIDDPDASTWSHPTLNRHSPPEVVANFKRRVPPRLPKPRKRDMPESQQLIPPPRPPPSPTPIIGRARGFSAPGAFAPAWARQGTSIPPLTVPPSDTSPHHYGDESPTSPYAYPSNTGPDSWSYTSSASSSSLSSLLNPSRPTPTINTAVSSQSNSTYASPFSSMPLTSGHSPLSPDHHHSRPGTSYYDEYGSRPNSSHRGHSPRPDRGSPYSIPGRRRRLTEATPYPVPSYDDSRPSTSPQPPSSDSSGLPRSRSMMHLSDHHHPSYPSHHGYPSHHTTSHHSEFAYLPSVPSNSSISSLGSTNYSYGARPSTSTSTSSQSQSQANTPPLDGYGVGVGLGGVGIGVERYGGEPDFGFVQMDTGTYGKTEI